MRFTINLATRTYLDHRLINRVSICVVAALLGLTWWNAGRVLSNKEEIDRLNSGIASMQKKLGTKPIGVSENEAKHQKASIRFYNEIIEHKSLNWLSILASFENTTPEGISLSSLSPGKDRHEWKIGGRAKSFKIVQQYLEKLEASKDFAEVLLLSHQNMTSGEKVRGIQFTISCKVLD